MRLGRATAAVALLALSILLAAPPSGAAPAVGTLGPDFPGSEGPHCEKRPILTGPIVAAGQCGDLATCLTGGSGQWGAYASVNGFGVLPEKPIFYCF